ncbi:uncharacterized protein [Periplaneta americana]|uniref:uncharacterized protein n=1 Tax=Periplaneta americana TaxID=6978 RepID=UPI0037E75393
MEEQKCVPNPIRSFVMLDLETTSLPYEKPVKITEIALVAAMREHILGFGTNITSATALPRVLSKLNLCVYPRKAISPFATEVTNLDNQMLEHQNPFDEHLFYVLDSFLKRMPKPVCLVAHNGLRFDFPVLQAELSTIGKTLPDDIMCADSLPAFRELIPKKNGSLYKKTVQLRMDDIVPLQNGSLSEGSKEIVAEGETISRSSDSAVKWAVKEICLDESGISPLKCDMTELLWNEYDEALSSVLDSVESSPDLKSGNKGDIFDDVDDQLCYEALDSVEKIKTKHENNESTTVEKIKTNHENHESSSFEQTPERGGTNVVQEAEGGSLQEKLEKTPDHSIQKDKTFKTPKTEKNKRGRVNVTCYARKRLNFSFEKVTDAPNSYKLGDLYRFLAKKEPTNCHRAEGDALTLLQCVIGMGDRFTDWADKNAIQFNSVQKMKQ